MSESNVYYKGFIFKSQLDALRKLKGEEVLAVLEKKFGPLVFNGFKEYPVEEEIRLQQEIAEIMFGKIDDEAWFKLGEVVFNAFAYSQIGKTIFSLFGNLQGNFSQLPSILKTISSGITCTVKKTGDRMLTITLTGEPHNPHHYQGVFNAGIRYFGFTPSVEIDTNSAEQTFIVSWR